MLAHFCYGRSVHRKSSHKLPCLTTKWAHAQQTYQLHSPQLEYKPLFEAFDTSFFNTHMLPSGPIAYRYQAETTVPGEHLSSLIEQLIGEIQQGKKQYTHFSIIRKKNFNRRKKCGLLILKFKNYPFVVKIFMETPQSFVKPYAKGVEPIFFFLMAGGVNRHLIGFTRIANLETINEKIANDPHWQNFVSTPRKWFWQPHNPQWIELYGTNLGPRQSAYTKIPGTYAIIADAIDGDHTCSIFNKQDKKLCMDLCNSLNHIIDPHIDNYIKEHATNKLVIVDTEHFPTVAGLKEEGLSFNNYLSWYSFLSQKCAQTAFFRTKSERTQAWLT